MLSREKEGSVLCSFCGRENPEDYHFCGMCGAELEKPSPAAPPAAPDVFPPKRPAPEAYPPRQPEPAESPAPPPQPPEFTRSSLSGPSLLGLDDQHSSTPEFSYLFEDEPGSGRGRAVVALLLIALLAGLGWWQVRRYGQSKENGQSRLGAPSQARGRGSTGRWFESVQGSNGGKLNQRESVETGGTRR